jgi:DUF971 family protein
MNPLAIGNSQAKGQLHLDWPDGREQRLEHAELRRQCPCSQCRAFRLRGLVVQVDPRIRVVAVNAQGYGVQLVFSDGHERGIYPWAYLAGLNTDGGGGLAREDVGTSSISLTDTPLSRASPLSQGCA